MRNSRRSEFGALEIARNASVLAEKDLLVHLFEIEREVEGAAHARVLEFVAPDIEGEGLHRPEIADRKFLQHDFLVLHGGEIVGGRPVLGAVLGAPIDLVALESFQRDGGIAEIFEADLLEVAGADIQVEVLAPIAGGSLVDDRAAGRKILDPVGTRAKRRLQRGLRYVALLARFVGVLPPVLRQDRQLTDNLRQFAVAGTVEGEGHFALAGFLRLGHVPVIGAELRTVLLERLEGIDHVFRRHRLAVVPVGIGAQAISHRRAVVRIADRFRQQPVFGGHFVERRRGQRLGEQIGAHGEAAFHARHHLIEVVEGAERDLAHRAALRRRRIDVVEMLEAVRIVRFAEQREAVLPLARRLGRLRSRRTGAAEGAQSRRDKRGGGAAQNGTAGQFHGKAFMTRLRRATRFSCNRGRLCRFFGPPPAASHRALTKRPGASPAASGRSWRCDHFAGAGAAALGASAGLAAGAGVAAAAFGSGSGLSAKVCR